MDVTLFCQVNICWYIEGLIYLSVQQLKSEMLNPEDGSIMTVRYVGWLPNDITTQKASVFGVWESQTSQPTSTQVSNNQNASVNEFCFTN